MKSNPRKTNWKARERAIAYVKRQVALGAPCAVCGKPIDLSVKWWIDPKDGKRKLSPWSIECDEIIPIARGGSPIDLDNVQPAHRICNQRKRDRLAIKVETHRPATSRSW